MSSIAARPTHVQPTKGPNLKPKQATCPPAPTCVPQTCLPACPKPCCKKFNDHHHTMPMIAGCPKVCFKKCDQICPRRCCGPHPPLTSFGQRPSINSIPKSPDCPKICADVCALECPHRCCGPGSMKRSFIGYIAAPQLAYIKDSYSYGPKRVQFPLSRYSNPRRFGLKKKRHIKF